MDPLTFLIDTDGFFTRRQALECGVAEREIAGLLRTGVWHRIRRGYYTFAETWTALDDVGRHLVRSAAVLHSLGPHVALSHVSALVARGISTWGMDLSRVHVTRLDKGAGRVEGDVVHHVGDLPASEVEEHNGLRCVALSRALIEAGSRASSESALVSFEFALHAKLVTQQELMATFEQMEAWPHTQHLHVPLRLAQDKSESVGESRGNWVFWSMGLPPPVHQFQVWDGDVLIATTDWGWPELETLAEFDGKVKYTRLLKPGQDASDVVFAEKIREDEVRRVSGFAMVRFTWSDWGRPVTCERRLRQAFRRRAS